MIGRRMAKQWLLAASLAGILAFILLLGGSAASTWAAEVHVAVAANFTQPMKQKIIPVFEKDSGDTVVATYGPTGGLYAQINNGAPYDIMLSADAERPKALEASGAGVAGTRFSFAFGKVVLWSPTPGIVDAKGEVLSKGNFKHLAVPNPKIAPYGLAAQQALQKLGLWEKLEPKVVYGQDLNQTYQMILSGNAALGFVALSQVKADRPGDAVWAPGADLYAPIDQQAILLTRSKDNAGARAFLAFLRSAKGKALIESFGYGVE
jgi:molybdate transport system substrate-binding protein